MINEKEEGQEKKLVGFRLHWKLLAPGEKPDYRPWGGLFDTGEHRRDDQKHIRYTKQHQSRRLPA